MMMVYHINIFQINSCGFVSYINFMFERQVPDRESFELGITRLDSVFIFVIEL